ncbi:MAG TPA: hypothetical protein VM184_00255 [Gaiellaceae bacterium]|nr:hypothetical protein [Gaiellaceae bacterium]
MEKISPPVRILALVLVLVGIGGMLALRTMAPSTEPVAIPMPAAKPAKAAAPAPVVKPVVKPKPAPKPVNAVVPPTGFPVSVDRALRRHEVVVVSLVVPGARVDELAAAEAQAGAKLGGAGFLALNVLNEDVARALLNKLETVQDPSVLVVKRSGEVALELAGFVDRETVAQAVANAAS